MKLSKLIFTLALVIYATSIFAFQLSPDSGASQFIGSVFGEHFLDVNAFSAMVTIATGAVSKFLSDLSGLYKLGAAIVIALVGALFGWFFQLGIFIELTAIESLKIGWTVAGGATLIHGIIKQIGFIEVIKGLFSKD